MLRIEVELKKEDFGEEYAGKYVFEAVSWGATNRISGECTSVHPVTKRSTIDLKMLQAKMLLATLKERPTIITLEHLLDETPKGLPPALGEFLMSAADKANGFSLQEREEIKKLKARWGLD